MMAKILVVNNDVDTMSLLQTWLEKKSYTVKYTSNGDDVVALARSFKPGLVLADILQSEAVLDIKNDSQTMSIPVILMTGYTTRYQTLKLPADDVIEKPFDLELLETKIGKLIL